MRIQDIIAIEGTNIRGKDPLIYLNIVESERKMIFRLISDYEYICRHIGLIGTLSEVNYNQDGGEVWLTYESKEVSIFIIEKLVGRISIDYIINDAFNLKQEQWEINLLREARTRNLAVIKLDDNKLQIGYGKNSRIITKDKLENEQDIWGNDDGIIPIISVTGTNGKTSTVKLMHSILLKLGYNCGLASTGAVYIGDKIIKKGDTTGFYSAQMVLTNPMVDVAVLETARGGMMRKGLGYKKNKVSVITSLSEDHFGINGINKIEDLLKVKKLIVEELLPGGSLVIGSNYYLVNEFKHMNNVILFNYCKDKYIEEFMEIGKEVWYVENGSVIFNKDGKEKEVLDIKQVPYTHYGKSNGNINNLLAALISLSKIHSNLNEISDVCKDIYCDLYTNPGRQNIIEFKGLKVILDYGHNEEAFKEIFGLAKKLNPTKITGIISAPGDRTDNHIKTLGKVAGEFCDEIIVKQTFDMRGRNALEIALLIQQGVLEYNGDFEDISLILDEYDAIYHAIKKAKKGEVIVVITQHLEVAIPCINNYLKSQGIEQIATDLDFEH